MVHGGWQMSAEFIGMIVSAILGSSVITALISHWFSNKKVKAEASDIALSGTVKWAESMRKDVERLSEEVNKLRQEYIEILKENSSLKLRIAHLEQELKGRENVAIRS